MLADLHSIKVPIEPDELRRRTLEFTAQLLACGIDAELRWSTNPSHGPDVPDPTAAPSAWSLGRTVAQRNESADSSDDRKSGGGRKGGDRRSRGGRAEIPVRQPGHRVPVEVS
jgi:hypothetical protein